MKPLVVYVVTIGESDDSPLSDDGRALILKAVMGLKSFIVDMVDMEVDERVCTQAFGKYIAEHVMVACDRKEP